MNVHVLGSVAIGLTLVCLAGPALAADDATAETADAALERAEQPQEETKVGVEVTLGRKGLGIATDDGAFKISIGARLHFDASGHVGNLPLENVLFGPSPRPVDPTDGVEVRRGRIQLTGQMWSDWLWALSVDFADDGVAVKDLFLAYAGIENIWIGAGQTKQPYSLSIEMSSNDIPFVERGIDTFLLAPFVDRALGVRASAYGEHWFVAAGVFGDTIDPTTLQDDGFGASARAIFSPLVSDSQVVHIGFRSSYRQPQERAEGVRIRSETTHQSNLFITDTGIPIRSTTIPPPGFPAPNGIYSVSDVILYGPEIALAFGPFFLTGEYNRARIDRAGQSTLDFQSGHVAAAWAITGESRAAGYNMSQGRFKRLDPKNPFRVLSREGCGAWEVAFRYAYLDVNDKDIRGGGQGAISTSLNWYPNYNVRMLLDWTRTVNTQASGSDLSPTNLGTLTNTASGLDVITFRVQFNF